MGMVDWDRDWDDEKQRWIAKPSFFKTDYKAIDVARRTRVESNCQTCGKKIISGEVCIGKDRWMRNCLKCSSAFIKKIRDEIGRFEVMMKATEQDLIKNEKKYETKNVLANLR